MSALFAIGLATAIAGGITSIVGAHLHGKAEREQLKEQKKRNEELRELAEEQEAEDRKALERQAAMDEGTLLTQAGAMGVSGTFTDAFRGYLLEEYNRAIGSLERQRTQQRLIYDWEQQDIQTAQRQSRINQAFGVTSTILDIGTNVAGMSVAYKTYRGGIKEMSLPGKKTMKQPKTTPLTGIKTPRFSIN